MDDYGLSPSNPVLCGKGPAGEEQYLGRLRCPTGRTVSFKRIGSRRVNDLRYLQQAGLALDSELAEIARLIPDEPVCVMLDCYAVVCACGSHSVKVYMDMYHAGPDLPISQEGWSLDPDPRREGAVPRGTA